MGQSAGAINVLCVDDLAADGQRQSEAVPSRRVVERRPVAGDQPAAGPDCVARAGVDSAGAGQRAAEQPADCRRAGHRHGVGAGLCGHTEQRRDRRLPALEKPGNALRHFADEDRATWALGVGSDPRRHRGAARPRRGDQCRQLRQGTGARDHHA